MTKKLFAYYLLMLVSSFSCLGQGSVPLTMKKGNTWQIVQTGKTIPLKRNYLYVNYFDSYGYAFYYDAANYGFIDSMGFDIALPNMNYIEHINQDFYLLDSLKTKMIYAAHSHYCSKINWVNSLDKNWIVFQKDTSIFLFHHSWNKPILIQNNTFINHFKDFVVTENKKSKTLYNQQGKIIDNKVIRFEINPEYLYVKGTKVHFVYSNNHLFQLPSTESKVRFIDDKFYYVKNDSLFLHALNSHQNILSIRGNFIEKYNRYYKIVTSQRKFLLYTHDGKTVFSEEIQNIISLNNGYLYKKNNRWGLLTSNFKVLIEPDFTSYNLNGDFIETQKRTTEYTSVYGIISLRNFKTILPVVYNRVIINSDTIIKAWKDSLLTIIKLYKNHALKEEIFINQVISINQTNKKIASINYDPRLIQQGWYFDTTLKERDDKTKLFINKWGMKSDDKIILAPRFNQVKYIENADFNLTLKPKPKKKSSNDFETNPFMVKTFGIPSYFENNYEVFSHEKKSIIKNVTINAMDTTDFHTRKFARTLTKNGFEFIYHNGFSKKVTYFSMEDKPYVKYCIDGDWKTMKVTLFSKNNKIKYSDYQIFTNPNRQSFDYEELNSDDNVTFKIVHGKWNYLKNNGDSILPESVEYVDDFIHNTAIYYNHGKYGLIDTGKVLIPNRYLSIERLPEYNDSLLLTCQSNNGFYFTDTNFNNLPFQNYHLISSGKKIAILQKGYENIVIDKHSTILGKTSASKINEYDYLIEKHKKNYVIKNHLLNPVFESSAKPLSFIDSTHFIGECNTKLGVLNLNGDTLLHFEYVKIYQNNHFIIAYKQGTNYIYDLNFNLHKKIEDATIYLDHKVNQLIVYKNNKILLYNQLLKKVNTFEFHRSIDTFYGGIILTRDKILFDMKGEPAVLMDFNPQKITFLKNYILIKYNSNTHQIVSYDGKKMINHFSLKKIHFIGNELVTYFDSETQQNTLHQLNTGKKITDFEMVKGDFFNDETIVLNQDNHALTLDSNLNIISTFYATDLSPTKYDFASFHKKMGYTLINKNGTIKQILNKGKIDILFPNLIKVDKNPLYGVINLKGEFIIPPIYEQINILSNGYFQGIKDEQIDYYTKNGVKIDIR